jgi:hypothetical protein
MSDMPVMKGNSQGRFKLSGNMGGYIICLLSSCPTDSNMFFHSTNQHHRIPLSTYFLPYIMLPNMQTTTYSQ